ncbi:uncharacterized protein LOC124315518 [Daphnia pulicaria]|uniref:uncharacterized protein LOC124315518 n=1 Tax=Daphnia pulicaria TaxID=35523 RepID=UPI001EEA7EA5|nr:uncharacterized protein LOC124315518 [Daphnia pulicaria]
MDLQPVKSELKINGTTAKPVLTEGMIKGMDHVYRSNPYPSKLEFETLCKDLLMSVGQAKNWFCNRRRRDSKQGKICRRCRFFKAPISEEAHYIAGSRPCISYWKLPTVAPPPLLHMTPLPMTSNNLSSSLDESVDGQQEQQNVKPEIDGNLATDYNVEANTSSVVPTAFSLTFQPGTYNFQQPIFNSEPNAWYQQHHDGQYSVDMADENAWMMRPAGTGQPSFWPINDYFPPPDFIPLMDQPLSSDWRLNQVQPLLPNYSMPYPLYPQYVYPDPNGIYDYSEQNGTSNN